MKATTFMSSYPISLPSFQDSFMPLSDNNSTDEGATMWVFLPFIRENAKEALTHQVTAGNKKKHYQGIKIITYFQLFPYLFEAYAAVCIMTNIEAEIMNF